MDAENIFGNITPKTADEQLANLLTAPGLRIERIVSHGHASEPGFWYDQEQHEWILLLKGRARLEFKDEEQPVELQPGSYLNIAAHRRHRVAWTEPREDTVWLAVHYGP